MTARTPEDLLAVVPIVLGFHPERSLVMLTFSGHRSAFHARVDLPAPAEAAAVVHMLLGAAERNDVDRVAFVLYTDSASEALSLARPLVAAFTAGGIGVLDLLRTDTGRWFPLAAGPEHQGTAYDASAHRFAAQGVFQGVVTHPTRLALSESLVGPDDARARVEAAIPPVLARVPDLQRDAEARWLCDLVCAIEAEGASPPSDDDVARLLVALLDVDFREIALAHLSRSTAAEQMALWGDVARRAPDDFLPAPATLMAFAAWLGGQGALAWCAVDRARAVDPDYSLAQLMVEVLEAAMPPSSWESVRPERHPLLDPASRFRRDAAGPIPGVGGSEGHTSRAG
jgi:hypothetical protein